MTSLRYETAEMLEFHYLDPDVQLAMAYASAKKRDSFAVLFLLDDALAKAVNATREPLIGRIRLSWWREKLEAMANGHAPPPEPLFQFMAKLALSPDVLRLLARVAEGWDVLLDDYPLSMDTLNRYARLRGGSLFEAAAVVVDTDAVGAGAVGEAWALTNFAMTCRDELTAKHATHLARVRFDVMPPSVLPRALRTFAIIAYLAWRDLQDEASTRPLGGSPKRMLRAARFALLRK